MKNKKMIFLLLIVTMAILFFGYKYQSNKRNEMIRSSDFKQSVNLNENNEDGKLFIDVDNEKIRIRSKYNDSKDIEIIFSKKGPNNLFDYTSTSFIENDEEKVSKTKVTEDFHVSSTDTFGPHKLIASNNIDGDLMEELHFTGGNHAFEGGSTGAETARTENIQFYIDDELVNNYRGYADEVEITWENFVQASNTKKIDGSGREVIKENYKIKYDGDKYLINNKIDFLEDLYWDSYYGLQFSYDKKWDGTITYSGDEEETYEVIENYTSGSLMTKSIKLSKDSNTVEFGVDIENGLGDRRFVNSTSNGAFNISKSNKAYFWIVDGIDMSEGETVELNGYYDFYQDN